MTKGGKLPVLADRHSGALLAAGGVAVTTGGVFMAVTALEPSKTPLPIWANAWFDVGFACLLVGLALSAYGLYLNYRKRELDSDPAEKMELMPVAATENSEPPAPPLVVKILPDFRFEGWERSVMIAALHLEVENTTDRDILVDGYEFTYETEPQSPWDRRVTNNEQMSVLQEIKRRELRQEHGQPLQNFTLIAARNRISGWYLKPVPRNPAGGTPECTVEVIDVIGNRYPAKLPRQEPRTYDPVIG